MAILLQYVSIPIGLILILMGEFLPVRDLFVYKKIRLTSSNLMIITGVILIIQNFPLVKFIEELKTLY